ncbi:MAG: hypothetical protein KG028_12090 [Actinobacteria bacterium]|jgi:hypothetical protein|nr:hypothetical protein [Actinomycetota bacterium]
MTSDDLGREVASGVAWPALALEGWRNTKDTLHRYCQMVGKVRLALAAFLPHWWHVTLYVTVDGLTTGLMPVADGRTLEVRLDLRNHVVRIADSLGQVEQFALLPRFACADFHDELLAALARLGVVVDVDMTPYDLDGPAFGEDYDNDTYDGDAVVRFAQVLRSSTVVLEEFAGRFSGKQSPVHLFWHSFDLAHARFSGRRAPVRAGAGTVEAEAYSHEVIAFGFWAGDDRVPYPAYYSYTAPAPAGLTAQPLTASEASWNEASGTATLPYDAVRTATDPRATLLQFFEDAYRAGARAAGWDLDDLATRAAP